MRRVAPAWAFFILMGFFVAFILPLGEGFDEPWHFGYVQYIAQTRKLPPGPALHLSVEMDEFLSRQPLGWRLHDIFPFLHSQDEYWQQSIADRAHIDRELREIRFDGRYKESTSEFTAQYESHQPPMFYALTAPLFLLASGFLSFADVFTLLRICSVLIASAVVPLSYLLAKRVSGGSAAVAYSVCILVAMFPGIYPDVVRISNDALAVPLAAAVFLSVAEYLESRSRRHALILGLLLLAGLSTKAFFIPVTLSIVAALLWLKEKRAAATIVLASSAGWLFYARNLSITGSFTGLPETVSAKTTVTSSLTSVGLIGWLDVFRLTAVSHVWIGNWSLLQYRGWIYRAILYVFIVGMIGFIGYLWKSRGSSIRVMLLIYVAFVASLIYYATQVFQQTGVPVIQGWYLSPFVPIEALAFVLGIGFLSSGRTVARVVSGVAFSFLAMSIYGNAFIAAPYYAGLIFHAPSGHLNAYHPRWADIPIMSERLTRLHPWLPDVVPLLLGIGVLVLGFILIYSQAKDRSCIEKSLR